MLSLDPRDTLTHRPSSSLSVALDAQSLTADKPKASSGSSPNSSPSTISVPGRSPKDAGPHPHFTFPSPPAGNLNAAGMYGMGSELSDLNLAQLQFELEMHG